MQDATTSLSFFSDRTLKCFLKDICNAFLKMRALNK